MCCVLLYRAGRSVVLVLEYAQRGDLAQYLRSFPGGVMSEATALPLFRQLVNGVAYAHANHVTHRDLKVRFIGGRAVAMIHSL
jgi:serine/threonine protein kinase